MGVLQTLSGRAARRASPRGVLPGAVQSRFSSRSQQPSWFLAGASQSKMRPSAQSRLAPLQTQRSPQHPHSMKDGWVCCLRVQLPCGMLATAAQGASQHNKSVCFQELGAVSPLGADTASEYCFPLYPQR